MHVGRGETNVAEAGTPDGLTKKLSWMHFCWQSAYFLVSASVPLPWTHFMAHCVVALTISSDGLCCFAPC